MNSKKLIMIANIDPLKSAFVSIGGAMVGTFSEKITLISAKITSVNFIWPLPVDTILERLAWTVAILAGGISAWNGLMTAIAHYKKNHPKKTEE